MQSSLARNLPRDLNGVQDVGDFGPIVGRSSAMLEVYDLIERVAPTDAPVLITGESGTGKELVAEAVHALSARSAGVFLPVNCSAVSPALFESELFGHERGSFTGADRRRIGHFERASGGTLLFDEMTEMPLELQAKLLRVLETGSLLRVGSSEPIAVSVRIIAITNREPTKAVASGILREDLFYRLNVFPIAIPPLRSRKDDIPQLARHFLSELNRNAGSSKAWQEGALESLQSGSWKGNVRELRSAVQRAFILAGNSPYVDPLRAPDEPATNGNGAASGTWPKVGTSIAMAEQELILATLEQLRGKKPEAATQLGISLKTLYSRINLYRARGVPIARDA